MTANFDEKNKSNVLCLISVRSHRSTVRPNDYSHASRKVAFDGFLIDFEFIDDQILWHSIE